MTGAYDWIAEGYQSFFGHLPEGIDDRIRFAEMTGTERALESVERMREQLIYNNPLGPKVQQLVHFGQLIALGHEGPARLHAASAIHHGATMEELAGVAETALITAGVPAYALGISILSALPPDGE